MLDIVDGQRVTRGSETVGETWKTKGEIGAGTARFDLRRQNQKKRHRRAHACQRGRRDAGRDEAETRTDSLRRAEAA